MEAGHLTAHGLVYCLGSFHSLPATMAQERFDVRYLLLYQISWSCLYGNATHGICKLKVLCCLMLFRRRI